MATHEHLTAGTVTRVDLEGGFFGIVTDGGEHLQPVNLPSDLAVDGLRVQFAFEPANVFSMHMWGQTVTVTDAAPLGE